MRTFISIAFLITCMVGFGAKCLKGDTLTKDDRGYIVNVGDKAPDFTMTLLNGDVVRLSDLKGKVVMLQFTASWCSVCRKEMPHIENDIWLKYKSRNDFALFGIDKDEPVEKVNQFVKAIGITYPMALDPRAEIFSRFAYVDAGVTRNVIINKSGKIAYMTRLFNQDEFDGMKSKICQLLEEKK